MSAPLPATVRMPANDSVRSPPPPHGARDAVDHRPGRADHRADRRGLSVGLYRSLAISGAAAGPMGPPVLARDAGAARCVECAPGFALLVRRGDGGLGSHLPA